MESWRADVVEGFRWFASWPHPPGDWPDFTNAAHWIVDDTGGASATLRVRSDLS